MFKSYLQARSSKEFLACYLKEKKKSANFSLSIFAKKAGIPSRGTIHDLVSGRRTVTRSLLPKISRALEIPLAERKVFEWLSEAELNPQLKEFYFNKIKQKINSLHQIKNPIPQKTKDSFFTDDSTPLVYSSLSSDKVVGISIEELVEKTGLHKIKVEKVLSFLQSSSLVEETIKNGVVLYYATNAHLIVTQIENSVHYKEFYLRKIKQLHKITEAKFEEEDHLFHWSLLHIKPEQAKILKKRINQTLVEFVDDSHQEGPKNTKAYHLMGMLFSEV